MASPPHALIMWSQYCVSCKSNGLRWMTLSGDNTWAVTPRLQDQFSGSLESRVPAQLGMGIVYASSLLLSLPVCYLRGFALPMGRGCVAALSNCRRTTPYPVQPTVELIADEAPPQPMQLWGCQTLVLLLQWVLPSGHLEGCRFLSWYSGNFILMRMWPLWPEREKTYLIVRWGRRGEREKQRPLKNVLASFRLTQYKPESLWKREPPL